MTATPLNIIPSKLAETSETTQYTSKGCKTLIDKLTAVNTGPDVAILTVHLVSSGAAPGAPNVFVKALTAYGTPGAEWPFPGAVGHVLEAGDYISTVASLGTISIRASGRQIT